MLLVGLAIGAWQGFWIAFVHVPPFITTLAGMLAFRGLSNVVLNGLTISIKNELFVKLFGGGAECYIPDLFGMEGFNLTCMLAGIIAVVLFIFIQFKGYLTRKSKGYETGSFTALAAKTVVLSLVILWFTFSLSKYHGAIIFNSGASAFIVSSKRT